MANPGFPRRGALTPEFGPKTYYLGRFLKNMHEMEEIGLKGGARPCVICVYNDFVGLIHFNRLQSTLFHFEQESIPVGCIPTVP